jgi:general secretion pathway protein A
MYLKHFNLSGRPFAGGPESQFFVPNDAVGSMVERLKAVISGRGAAAAISGGPGVGKTALVTHAAAQVADETVLARADIRQWEPESLLDQLLLSLGMDAGDGSGPLSRHRLQDAVREHNLAGSSVVAIVDVGTVSAERAKRLLRLAHMLGEDDLGLNLVLTGPHTVHKVLDVPGMIHLRQRICVRHRVRPLSEEETRRYIADGLGMAGGDPTQILGEEVPGMVYRYVAGVPRLVNTMMVAALRDAALQRLPRVTADVVSQVAQGLGWRPLAGKHPGLRPGPAKSPATTASTAPNGAPSPLQVVPPGRPANTPAAPAQSDMTAARVAPLGLSAAAKDGSAAGEPKKSPLPDTAMLGVPDMDPDDTSATGMLRLEDLDERFAEHVFSQESS